MREAGKRTSGTSPKAPARASGLFRVAVTALHLHRVAPLFLLKAIFHQPASRLKQGCRHDSSSWMHRDKSFAGLQRRLIFTPEAQFQRFQQSYFGETVVAVPGQRPWCLRHTAGCCWGRGFFYGGNAGSNPTGHATLKPITYRLRTLSSQAQKRQKWERACAVGCSRLFVKEASDGALGQPLRGSCRLRVRVGWSDGSRRAAAAPA